MPDSFGCVGGLAADSALEESFQLSGPVHNGYDFEWSGLVAVGDDIRVNCPEALPAVYQIFPMMAHAGRLCQAGKGGIQPF